MRTLFFLLLPGKKVMGRRIEGVVFIDIRVKFYYGTAEEYNTSPDLLANRQQKDGLFEIEYLMSFLHKLLNSSRTHSLIRSKSFKIDFEEPVHTWKWYFIMGRIYMI